MDALLAQLPPLMAIVIAGGGVAMTWMAKLVLALLAEARIDREKYISTVRDSTSAIRDSAIGVTEMRTDMRKLAESIEMMSQVVTKTFSDQRADERRRTA